MCLTSKTTLQFSTYQRRTVTDFIRYLCYVCSCVTCCNLCTFCALSSLTLNLTAYFTPHLPSHKFSFKSINNVVAMPSVINNTVAVDNSANFDFTTQSTPSSETSTPDALYSQSPYSYSILDETPFSHTNTDCRLNMDALSEVMTDGNEMDEMDAGGTDRTYMQMDQRSGDQQFEEQSDMTNGQLVSNGQLIDDQLGGNDLDDAAAAAAAAEKGHLAVPEIIEILKNLAACKEKQFKWEQSVSTLEGIPDSDPNKNHLMEIINFVENTKTSTKEKAIYLYEQLGLKCRQHKNFIGAAKAYERAASLRLDVSDLNETGDNRDDIVSSTIRYLESAIHNYDAIHKFKHAGTLHYRCSKILKMMNASHEEVDKHHEKALEYFTKPDHELKHRKRIDGLKISCYSSFSTLQRMHHEIEKFHHTTTTTTTTNTIKFHADGCFRDSEDSDSNHSTTPPPSSSGSAHGSSGPLTPAIQFYGEDDPHHRTLASHHHEYHHHGHSQNNYFDSFMGENYFNQHDQSAVAAAAALSSQAAASDRVPGGDVLVDGVTTTTGSMAAAGGSHSIPPPPVASGRLTPGKLGKQASGGGRLPHSSLFHQSSSSSHHEATLSAVKDHHHHYHHHHMASKSSSSQHHRLGSASSSSTSYSSLYQSSKSHHKSSSTAANPSSATNQSSSSSSAAAAAAAMTAASLGVALNQLHPSQLHKTTFRCIEDRIESARKLVKKLHKLCPFYEVSTLGDDAGRVYCRICDRYLGAVSSTLKNHINTQEHRQAYEDSQQPGGGGGGAASQQPNPNNSSYSSAASVPALPKPRPLAALPAPPPPSSAQTQTTGLGAAAYSGSREDLSAVTAVVSTSAYSTPAAANSALANQVNPKVPSSGTNYNQTVDQQQQQGPPQPLSQLLHQQQQQQSSSGLSMSPFMLQASPISAAYNSQSSAKYNLDFDQLSSAQQSQGAQANDPQQRHWAQQATNNAQQQQASLNQQSTPVAAANGGYATSANNNSTNRSADQTQNNQTSASATAQQQQYRPFGNNLLAFNTGTDVPMAMDTAANSISKQQQQQQQTLAAMLQMQQQQQQQQQSGLMHHSGPHHPHHQAHHHQPHLGAHPAAAVYLNAVNPMMSLGTSLGGVALSVGQSMVGNAGGVPTTAANGMPVLAYQ